MSQYLIADIETTGLVKGLDEILEFSYLVMDDTLTKVIDRGALYLYHPLQRDSHPKAFEVHGLTKEYLKQFEPEFYNSLGKIYKLFCKSNFVGFNSDRFDIPFIKTYLSMHGFGVPEINSSIDIMKIYTPFYGRMSLRKLMEKKKVDDQVVVTLLRHYFAGYPFREHAHNAAFDVIETMILAAEAKRDGLF